MWQPGVSLLAEQGWRREANEVIIWDYGYREKQIAKFLETAQAANQRLVLSADGRTLAVISNSNLALLLDTRDWQILRSLDHIDQVWSVDFSPDASMLATGDKAGNVSIWNTMDGSLIGTRRGHNGYVRSVRFTRDGRTLASGGDDKRILLWDPVTATHLCALLGSPADIYTLAFSPDDGLLVSGSYDGTIRFWHAERQE